MGNLDTHQKQARDREDWVNMVRFLLALGFISSIHCQIKFSAVANPPSPRNSPTSIVTTEFAFPSNPTNLSSFRPTPRSAEIRFPGYSTAVPSAIRPSPIPTTPTNTRLFALNEWGHIECQERTDCPPNFVDIENKEVVKYTCEKPISQIIADREGGGFGGKSFAAPPDNEDPAKTCAEDLAAFYCADPTRPGCDVCPGFSGQASSSAGPVPGYCFPKPVFFGSPPNYLTGSAGQTVSSLGGLQGQAGCPARRPCRSRRGRCCRLLGLGRGGRVLACPRSC